MLRNVLAPDDEDGIACHVMRIANYDGKKQANRMGALMTAMHPARPASPRFDLLQQIKNIHLRNEAEEIKWRIEQ